MIVNSAQIFEEIDQWSLMLLTWLASATLTRPPQVPALAAGSIPASPCSRILDKDGDSTSNPQVIPIVLRPPILFR